MPDTLDEFEVARVFRQLCVTGAGAPSLSQKLELAQGLRARHPDIGPRVDEALISEVERLRNSLERASRDQQELRKLFDRLTAPPWTVATLLGVGAEPVRGPSALVGDGAGRRVVGFADGLDPAAFAVGDAILLGPERNLVVGRAPMSHYSSGETGVFDRMEGTGRVVLKSRDEEIVLTAAHTLLAANPRPGDLVRWDRSLWLAFEKVERSHGSQLFLESTPSESFDDIGGLDAQIAELRRTITLHYRHPELVTKYALQRRSAVLLAGPPGTGKTLLARGIANFVATFSSTGRARFMNIRPAQLHSMWFSQSESNYREAFRVAREASAQAPDIPVVMFFDEVDAVGEARGDSLGRVDGRVMTAFLSELDGLEGRGNVFVVCATNRRDALDPALLRSGGRLGDIVLEVPRPNRAASRAIMLKHLPAGIPYGALDADEDARQALVDSAVARIFAPNARLDLARLTMRDGKEQTVTAADLVSGAAIANIARRAIEHACLRELDGGEAGVRVDDLLASVDAEFEAAARTLTPANVRRFIEGLPHDADVVRVQRSTRAVRAPYRYLQLS